MLPIVHLTTPNPNKKYQLIPAFIQTSSQEKEELQDVVNKPNVTLPAESSGRIDTLANWNLNPQQGVIEYIEKREITESFSDLIDSILEEYSTNES